MQNQLDNKAVGQRIRQRLKETGENQTTLGKAIGVGQSAVNQWLSGATHPKKIDKVAKFLKTTVEWLEYGTGDKEPPQHRIQKALVNTPDETHADPFLEAQAAKTKIYEICRDLSPDAKKKIDPLRLAEIVLETLGYEAATVQTVAQAKKNGKT